MSVVGMPAAAKQLARLVAMVVLPAPPFGLSTRVVFISARGSASPFSCVELGLLADDAARNSELQEKLEEITFEYHCSSTIRNRGAFEDETQVRLGARARERGRKGAAPAGEGDARQHPQLRLGVAQGRHFPRQEARQGVPRRQLKPLPCAACSSPAPRTWSMRRARQSAASSSSPPRTPSPRR